jgi:PleD family two-component response regulator
MGIASLNSDHPASADALVAMADRALYMAKDRGKDQIVAYGRSGIHVLHA